MRHVYIHVPFCARRCSYCDFAIAVRKNVPADRYVAAIERELEFRRAAGEWNDEPLETLYLGGGTPSLLPPESVARVIELFLRQARSERADSRRGTMASLGHGVPEITLEANPDDVTPGAAIAWREAGVTRVSLGAQSFEPSVLRWMHRTHDVAAVPRAADALRAAGIDSLSLDLMFGLPDAIGADFPRDLKSATALAPDHLSIYGLSVEPRTPLARWVSRGTTAPPSDERYAAEFLLAHQDLVALGYEHYEVSNYALPGRRSRHNSAYWSERAYGGLGPAAHSFQMDERRWNLAPWASYERAVMAGRDPTLERERLTASQRRIERLYLGLRTVEGIRAETSWGIPNDRKAVWEAAGWLQESERDVLSLTPAGWLRLDEMVAVLTTLSDGG